MTKHGSPSILHRPTLSASFLCNVCVSLSVCVFGTTHTQIHTHCWIQSASSIASTKPCTLAMNTHFFSVDLYLCCMSLCFPGSWWFKPDVRWPKSVRFWDVRTFFLYYSHPHGVFHWLPLHLFFNFTWIPSHLKSIFCVVLPTPPSVYFTQV